MRLADPPVGHRVDVDGARLWTHRSGTGEPVVVFVPGAGGMGLDFLLAHEQVAAFTTAVSYDRAGTGWSDDVALPRSLDQVTDELRALLHRVDLSGPYVLVGHSLGGAYVQRYAQRFPGEIAGLVLLEPAHQDWDDYQPPHLKLANTRAGDVALPELTDDLVAHVRGVLASSFAALPESVREQVVDQHVSAERLPTGMMESGNVLALFEELRAGGPLPDVPVIILSGTAIDASQTMFQTEDVVREQITGTQRLYDAVAARAARGEHRTLPDASHVTLPVARPDAVARAVRDVLADARRG